MIVALAMNITDRLRHQLVKRVTLATDMKAARVVEHRPHPAGGGVQPTELRPPGSLLNIVKLRV